MLSMVRKCVLGLFHFYKWSFQQRVNIYCRIDEIYLELCFHLLTFLSFFLMHLLYRHVYHTCMGEKDSCVFHFYFIYIPGLLDHFRPINKTLHEAHRTAGSSMMNDSGHFKLQESWIKQTVVPSIPRSLICLDITIVVFLFFFNGKYLWH